MTVGVFDGGDDPYPVGTIMIWSGTIDEIPMGWSLCDGTDGTPNLLDAFVRSVPDNVTDPGSTGGQNYYTLSESQMPSHNHSGSTESGGSHTHNWYTGYNSSRRSSFSDGSHGMGGSNTSTSTTSGSHSHSFTTSPTGNGDSIDNRPSHVELAYIQKK